MDGRGGRPPEQLIICMLIGRHGPSLFHMTSQHSKCVCLRVCFLTCLARAFRVIKDESRVGVGSLGWKFFFRFLFFFFFFSKKRHAAIPVWKKGGREEQFSNCGNDAVTLCHKWSLCKFAICHAATGLCRWKLGLWEIAANYSITGLDGEADPAWQRWQHQANHLPEMALN